VATKEQTSEKSKVRTSGDGRRKKVGLTKKVNSYPALKNEKNDDFACKSGVTNLPSLSGITLKGKNYRSILQVKMCRPKARRRTDGSTAA
jgi:hypothetical protein